MTQVLKRLLPTLIVSALFLVFLAAPSFHARQDGCGGPTRFVEIDDWFLSSHYVLEGGIPYDFHVTALNGTVLQLLAHAPWPGGLVDRNEAWCTSTDPGVPGAGNTYEILVSSSSPENVTEGRPPLKTSLYFADSSTKPPPPFTYTLKALEDTPTTRGNPTDGVEFSNPFFRLSISSHAAQDGRQEGELDLSIGGASSKIPVLCAGS